MHSDHLSALGLVCPACRAQDRGDQPLALGHVARADRDDLVEGALACAHPACRREHPIIDGVPVVVADLPAWARHQLDAVLRRRDLSPWLTSLLGDAAGAGTVLDDARRAASTYATSHYGATDADASYLALARIALALAPPTNAALALDLGCAVGRGTFELAAAGAALAVGIDLDFGMLAIAERARTTGVARYERRRVGVVYEPREDAVAPTDVRARTGFLCADVLNLPIPAGRARHALAINVLDVVGDPARMLGELARALAPDSNAIVASPYDWSASATPLAGWLGGHSQRGELAGAPETVLRAVLPRLGLAVVAERDRVPWRLPVHARATMEYAVHVVHCRRAAT